MVFPEPLNPKSPNFSLGSSPKYKLLIALTFFPQQTKNVFFNPDIFVDKSLSLFNLSFSFWTYILFKGSFEGFILFLESLLIIILLKFEFFSLFTKGDI